MWDYKDMGKFNQRSHGIHSPAAIEFSIVYELGES